MVTAIPATGTLIRLGSVYNAYYVAGATGSPAAGTVVQLSAKLAGNVGVASGTVISLSSSFGGKSGPNNYTPG
jgi:hypothetical protein